MFCKLEVFFLYKRKVKNSIFEKYCENNGFPPNLYLVDKEWKLLFWRTKTHIIEHCHFAPNHSISSCNARCYCCQGVAVKIKFCQEVHGMIYEALLLTRDSGSMIPIHVKCLSSEDWKAVWKCFYYHDHGNVTLVVNLYEYFIPWNINLWI